MNKPWDELTEDEKIATAARIRRYSVSAHGDVRRNRLDAITMAIDFLRAKGFGDAAAALEGEVFEVAP